MATFEEIVGLRKGGNYMASYEMALTYKFENPNSPWINNQIGWCLFEMLKANSSTAKSEEFLLRLQEVVDINNERPLDGFIINNLVWPVRAFVVNCCNNGTLLEDLLYRVFGILQQIPFDIADENYGILLGAFVKAKKWGGLKQFIEWWNLDNIKAKDCETFKTKDGKTVMSVAEQAFIAYSNVLLEEIASKVADEEQVKAYTEKLAQVATSHPEFQYPSYFQAKLLLGIGYKEEAMEALMPFVKKKAKDFWVWELLGDAQSDIDLRISCYCKALLCHGKEQYLRKLHLKLCDIFLKKEMYNEARAELTAAITISNNNGWALPFNYQDYTMETWYLSADKNADNTEFYKDNASSAEQLTYSDYPQTAIVVVKINKEKQVANFVTPARETGFFSCKGIKCKVGAAYLCKMENDNGNHYKVYVCEPINGVEKGLIKEFSGPLTIKQGGYGFVGDIFVKASMKKGKWGWTTLRLFDNNI